MRTLVHDPFFRALRDKLIAFNRVHAPFTQAKDFISLNFYIKNENNTVIAGITAVICCWGILYIEILFVEEGYRHQQLGSLLLSKVEAEAQSKGTTLSHLDTFDWQAKEFYIKHGYEIFGILEGCPLGHTRYYMKKTL